jgi:hypothetical protein
LGDAFVGIGRGRGFRFRHHQEPSKTGHDPRIHSPMLAQMESSRTTRSCRCGHSQVRIAQVIENKYRDIVVDGVLETHWYKPRSKFHPRWGLAMETPSLIFRFGPFEAKTRARDLSKNGTPLRLRGQPCHPGTSAQSCRRGRDPGGNSAKALARRHVRRLRARAQYPD